MNYCPAEVLSIFKEKFEFPNKPLFGVVATRRGEGINTRMMRIYEIDAEGKIILLTHTGTEKWREFDDCSHVSICVVREDKLLQVLLRGIVKLQTKKDVPEIASAYWEHIRPDVKMIYDSNYHPDQGHQEISSLLAPQAVPETSGIVTVRPDFWEILELKMPYTDSRRFQFQFSLSGWAKKRMSVG